MAFLLSYLQHTRSLYPPSILLENPLLTQGLSTELPPLIPSAIPLEENTKNSYTLALLKLEIVQIKI